MGRVDLFLDPEGAVEIAKLIGEVKWIEGDDSGVDFILEDIVAHIPLTSLSQIERWIHHSDPIEEKDISISFISGLIGEPARIRITGNNLHISDRFKRKYWVEKNG